MCTNTTRVEIALASDDKYFQGLLVTAVSMVEHASPEADLSFNILDGGISHDNFSFFEKRLADLNPLVRIKRIAVDQLSLRQFPQYWSSKMTYARLLLPIVLPDIDFVVYSDVDFIWLADVSLLWQQRDEEVAILAPHDSMEETLSMEEKWFADNHVTFNREQYFCAGLAILNLRRFRQESYMMKVIEFLRVHEDLKFADQTALNAILLHDVKLLDKKWHTLTACAQNNSLLQPTALHFAGDAPWKISKREDLISDTAMLWFQYYAHVIGSSTWKCLISKFTLSQILFKRSFFLIFASSIVARQCLYYMFRLLKREHSSRFFAVRLRRVRIRQVRFDSTLCNLNLIS